MAIGMYFSRLLGGAAAGAMTLVLGGAAQASDHLDTPSVVADPAADIGDIFAWMTPDARRLNLVMTIVGKGFSDRHAYVFHVDSGRRFGTTTATVDITCRFDGGTADCRAGDADRATGAADGPQGLAGAKGRMRVFAGPRDDPFFNNVRGTREAYNVAAAALAAGAPRDAAGCPVLGARTGRTVLDTWRHTTGGPPQNLLAGWTPASIVVSVDVGVVDRGGPLLAVWAETATAKGRIDRMGRPLTGNALLATLGTEAESNGLKERYNRATPATADEFVGEIETGLALYDGLDGQCGNAWLAAAGGGASRYLPLAALLADDRLWVNSAAGTCTALFAVERAALSGRRELAGDCGGRTPTMDAVDVYRSLLVGGTTDAVTDGADRDEIPPSDTVFPFLAPPAVKP